MRPVRRIPTEVHSLGLDAFGEPVLRLRTPPAWQIDPGQAVLADLGDSCGLLSPLFPCEVAPGLLSLPIEADSTFRPGMPLSLAAPIGTGFRPPPASRRWLLASSEAVPRRLLPLLKQGIERGVEIVFAGEPPAHGLPLSIEVVSRLDQGLAWSDYLALDSSRRALPDMLVSLAGAGVVAAALAAEILVASDILCGWGGCGACAVYDARGWFLACVEGPVRPLSSLLERDGRRGA